MTMNNQVLRDGVLIAILGADENVRYATVVRKPGAPTKVVVYRGRQQPT